MILAAFVAAATVPALAQENPFRDVPTNSWAYQAIQKLYADGLVEGYPGGYFKGQRPLTRYEAAVLTERVVKKLEEELSVPAEAAKVNAADIAAVKKLVDEYGADIANLKKDVAGLKDQVAKNSATLNRQQFHMYFANRMPGFYRDNVAAFTPTGAALPGNTVLNDFAPAGFATVPVTEETSPGVFVTVNKPIYTLHTNVSYENLGANNQQSGTFAHGTGYQITRLIFSGAFDDKTSYAVRIEDRNYLSNQAEASTATGNFGSPNSGGYFYNQYFRINYAYLTYKDPSGLYAKVGRYVEGGGPIGLAFADYFQGVELGYSKSGLTAYAGYSFNYSNGVTVNPPPVGGPYQTILAHADYNVTPKFNFGLNYSIDRGVAGTNFWNPSVNPYAPGTNCTPGFCGAYVSGPYPLAVGSFNASYQFTPEFSVLVEGLHRFGDDPATGSTWKDANSVWGEAYLGKTAGHVGNNYGELGVISSGFNSNGPHTEIEGTPDYEQLFFNNPNGYNIGYVGLHHWFSNNARVGVVYEAWNVKSGIDIPLGGGYYISKDPGSAIFLQTLVSF